MGAYLQATLASHPDWCFLLDANQASLALASLLPSEVCHSFPLFWDVHVCLVLGLSGWNPPLDIHSVRPILLLVMLGRSNPHHIPTSSIL